MKLFLIICCICISFVSLYGGVCKSTPQGGYWNEAATWVDGKIPTAADEVIIVGKVFAEKIFTCRDITIEKDSELKITTSNNLWSVIDGTLTVKGCFEVTENSQLRVLGKIDNQKKDYSCFHNGGIIEVGVCDKEKD